MAYRKGTQVVEKRILFINRRAPHGTGYALEALEVVLVGAAFEQFVSVLFLDDGVLQLLSEQRPEVLGIKNFAKGFRTLPDYEVNGIYVEARALAERGFTADDLLMPTTMVAADEIQALMANHDVVFSF